MTAWLSGGVLVALLILPWCAQGGRATCDMWNRCTWLLFGCGVALILGMSRQNPYAALAAASLVTGTLTVAPWEHTLGRAVYPAYAAGLAWVVLTPLVTPALVPPVLGVLVGLGAWSGLWTLRSNWQGQRAYQQTWGRAWGRLPRPLMCWHEDSPTHLKGGQGNSNHLLSLAALAASADLALAWARTPWVLAALPLVLVPLLIRVNKEGLLSQGHVHGLTGLVAVASGWFVSGWAVLAWFAGYGLLGVVVARPWDTQARGWDGRRFALWALVLREVWWPMGWRRRLLGVGTATWEPLTAPVTIARLGGVVFTTAHNEYVQYLVEHGMLGLAALLLYLVTTGVTLWHGGPEGQMLLVVACTLCSVACANFPWTWFHEIPQPPTCLVCQKPAMAPGVAVPETHCRCAEPRQLGPSLPLYVGSPGLVAVSLVVAILAEAF